MTASRREEALDILKLNDRGDFSVPTHGLYPVQFNWDSAFAALGYRFIDKDRAWRELELLASAQWEDGMIPHIMFRGDHDGYFPGPDVWRGGRVPQSSGITQPPVLASCVRRLLSKTSEPPFERFELLVKRIERWHAWFTRARQDANGAIFIIHPWESGRDNLTDWDSAMSQVMINHGLGTYKRRDLDHVDANQRPTMDEYDRYLTIVKYGGDLNWDQEEVGRSSPFRMVDPGMTAMLLRSERDLLMLLETAGLDETATRARIKTLEAGWESLWNPVVNAYTSRQVDGPHTDAVSSASFLGPYAGMTNNLASVIDHFDRFAKAAKYMVPSFDPEHPHFDSARYWRGPVWSVVNSRIGTGLAEIGELARARRVAQDTVKMTEAAGFSEYFDPISGAGCGGKLFTWTASTYLDWALPFDEEWG